MVGRGVREEGRIVGRWLKGKVKSEKKRQAERRSGKSTMNHWRLIHPFGGIAIDRRLGRLMGEKDKYGRGGSPHTPAGPLIGAL